MMRGWLRGRWPLLVVVFLFVLVELLLLSQGRMLLWDEPVYLSNARGHVSGSYFGEDFRFPLLELFVAGAWSLTGESLLVAQLLIVAFGVVAIVAFWGVLGFLVRDDRFRIGATALFALGGLLLYWSFRVYTDVPGVALLLVSSWCLLRYDKGGEWYFALLSGVFLGLSFLMRFSLAAFVVAMVPVFVSRDRWRGVVSFVVGGLVATVPWMLYNLLSYGELFWDFFEQARVVGMYTSWQPVPLFLGYLFVALGALLVFLVPFFRVVYKRRDRVSLTVVFFVVVSFLLASLTPLKLPRYLLAVVPFFILACVVGAERWYGLVGKRWRRVAGVVLVVLLSVQVVLSFSASWVFLSREASCFEDSSAHQALLFSEAYIPAGDLVISNSWPWYGYFGDHRARSTWSSDVSEVVGEDSHAWLFVQERGGLDVVVGV